jgi:hypothetical protein
MVSAHSPTALFTPNEVVVRHWIQSFAIVVAESVSKSGVFGQ